MGSYANLFSGAGGIGSSVGAGAGALGDIYSLIQNQQQRQNLQNVYNIAANPQALAKYVSQFTSAAASNQPLQNTLNANWAAQTGGGMGGAFNQYIADALTKIGYENAMKSLGLAGTTGANIGQQPMSGALGDIFRNLRAIQQQPSGGAPTALASITEDPNLIPGGYNPNPAGPILS